MHVAPRDDVAARMAVGVVTVLSLGLASFLTVTVAGGLVLGTSVVGDGMFDVALLVTWASAGLGLVATRWLYEPERMGGVARFCAILAVSLLVVAGVTLTVMGAPWPAALAMVLAVGLAALAARRGDAL
jgi:hypothetical protein